jgi:hypothetical protein
MNLRKPLITAAIALALATLGACARDDADDGVTDVAPSAPATDAYASSTASPAPSPATSPVGTGATASTELSGSALPATAGPESGTLAPGNNLVRADTNGDGLISRAEADADVELRDRFTSLDTNADGSLSSDEWLSASAYSDTPQ